MRRARGHYDWRGAVEHYACAATRCPPAAAVPGGQPRNKLYEPWANSAGYRLITETVGPGICYACCAATVDQAHQQQADRARRFATLPQHRKHTQVAKRTAHALQQQAGAGPAPAASLPTRAPATAPTVLGRIMQHSSPFFSALPQVCQVRVRACLHLNLPTTNKGCTRTRTLQKLGTYQSYDVDAWASVHFASGGGRNGDERPVLSILI